MKILGVLFPVFLFLFALSIYTLTLRGVPGNIKSNQIAQLNHETKPFELSPERGRFILTKSLADNNSFALSNDLAQAAKPDVGYYQGRKYVYFAPGISIMALPFYVIGKIYNLSQVATFFMISLFASLSGCFARGTKGLTRFDDGYRHKTMYLILF